MSAFAYGDRVRVSYVTRPVYIEAHTEQRVPRPAGSPAVDGVQFYEIHDDGPLQLRSTAWEDPDLGDPLPDPSPEIDAKGTYRRLRRFPCGRNGVVVGRTRRQEGRYHEAGGTWGHESEPDPPFLAQSRTVEVFQVALAPEVNGRHPWPCTVVIAVADDLSHVRGVA